MAVGNVSLRFPLSHHFCETSPKYQERHFFAQHLLQSHSQEFFQKAPCSLSIVVA